MVPTEQENVTREEPRAEAAHENSPPHRPPHPNPGTEFLGRGSFGSVPCTSAGRTAPEIPEKGPSPWETRSLKSFNYQVGGNMLKFGLSGKLCEITNHRRSCVAGCGHTEAGKLALRVYQLHPVGANLQGKKLLNP